MTPHSQSGETIDQARRRLAQKASESGVTLRREADGRSYASSVSQPGSWHYVTGLSCDCLGFQRVQRCMHHSAFLEHLGWLPEDDPRDPDPAAPSTPIVGNPIDAWWVGTPDGPEPVTAILVDGAETLRVTGAADALRVQLIDHGQVINDLTKCTPGDLDHLQAVALWVERIGAAILAQRLVPLGDHHSADTMRDAA